MVWWGRAGDSRSDSKNGRNLQSDLLDEIERHFRRRSSPFSESRHTYLSSKRSARIPISKVCNAYIKRRTCKVWHDGKDARAIRSAHLARRKEDKRLMRVCTRSAIGFVTLRNLSPEKKHNVDVCDIYLHIHSEIYYLSLILHSKK